MELVWIIYFIEVVTNIKMVGFTEIMGVFTAVSLLYTGICVVYAKENKDICFKDCMKNYSNFIKRKLVFIPLVSACIIGSLFNALTPSKETAYVMLGAYGVQSVAETIGKNQEVQQIGKRTLSIVETALTKYEKELKVEEKELDNKK